MLIKNSFLNILGYIVPFLIYIPTTSYLARNLTITEFGTLSLIVAAIGYSGFLDLGLNRAIVREISISETEKSENKVIATSTIFFIILYLAIIFIATPLLYYFEATKQIIKDNNFIFTILLITIPIHVISSFWSAIFEGKLDFLLFNKYKIITNSILAILPALFLYLFKTFDSVIISILISKTFSIFILYFIGINKRKPFYYKNFSKPHLIKLLSFGGWLTISNLISPIMVYFDRFFISFIYGNKYLGFYSAPAELISRFLVYSTSITRVLFPKISKGDYCKKEITLSYTIILIPTLFLFLFFLFFSNNFIEIWLGPNFINQSSIILKILSFGLIFNSLAQIPFSNIQAKGFSKITAKIHLLEIIPYLLILYLLTDKLGITGTAISWSLRVFFDFLILYFVSKKLDKKII